LRCRSYLVLSAALFQISTAIIPFPVMIGVWWSFVKSIIPRHTVFPWVGITTGARVVENSDEIVDNFARLWVTFPGGM